MTNPTAFADRLAAMQAAARLPFTQADPPPADPPPSEPLPDPVSQQPAPAWRVEAFAALPDDVRAGVLAGMAATLGREALTGEAELMMRHPTDAHLHVTDPSRFVDAQGHVDRQAIRSELWDLVYARPELRRPERSEEPRDARHSPPAPRRALPGSGHGPSPAAVAFSNLDDRVARMRLAAGIPAQPDNPA